MKSTSRATDRLILRPSAVPDLNLPQPPISEARKRLIEGRAERAANRAKVGAAMDQRHDTPNLSDLAIDAECADHPEVCVPTVEKAVQVDTTDLDKLKVKRISANSFGSDDDLVSWTGLKSREMLESIVKAVTLVKQYSSLLMSSNWTVSAFSISAKIRIKVRSNIESCWCLQRTYSSIDYE
ncbi:uncharacterized protein LOC129761254 [Toxorhynchites rutilus septentrionalis]|uniref:uncharacterized protein LOC129761254 n=1 Tax=Toxorhynchites rutilus septentrionalis TaxID=329112 RepID=UPI0024796A39|nr:uncharacterized protein LOC129761254 [Toxorhynchites rutilus septentrionalis]